MRRKIYCLRHAINARALNITIAFNDYQAHQPGSTAFAGKYMLEWCISTSVSTKVSLARTMYVITVTVKAHATFRVVGCWKLYILFFLPHVEDNMQTTEHAQTHVQKTRMLIFFLSERHLRCRKTSYLSRNPCRRHYDQPIEAIRYHYHHTPTNQQSAH